VEGGQSGPAAAVAGAAHRDDPGLGTARPGCSAARPGDGGSGRSTGSIVHRDETGQGGGRFMAKNGEPVIDMHGHAQIKAADELIRKVFSPEKEPFVAFASPLTNEVNRRQLERVWPKLTSVEVKLADMDAMGIDLQVVSPSPFQCAYWTEPDLGVEIAQIGRAHV